MLASKPTAGFDEAWYVAFHPDVQAAVAQGVYQSGWEHYVAFGRREGRAACAPAADAFDAAWYANSYPMARIEVERGLAPDYAAHYDTMGRRRGYLPNPRAERPAQPGAIASAFGGTWADRGDAHDLIAGRRELGLVDDEEAALLTHWVEKGYVVIPGALDAAALDKAEAALDAAYAGKIDHALLHCPGEQPYALPWSESVAAKMCRALDLHWLSADIRAVIFAPKICRFLELVFERRCLASQSLTFRHGSGQAHHMDTFYVPYTSPMQFAASWVALEDVRHGAGELSYFAGSHKLPERVFGGEFKSAGELQRVTRDNDPYREIGAYEAQLGDLARQYGMPEETFLARRGDVLIWHAGLAHGGRPVIGGQTRKSVVTHYCPREIAPLFWEEREALMRSYEDRAYYSTVYYQDHDHG